MSTEYSKCLQITPSKYLLRIEIKWFLFLKSPSCSYIGWMTNNIAVAAIAGVVVNEVKWPCFVFRSLLDLLVFNITQMAVLIHGSMDPGQTL